MSDDDANQPPKPRYGEHRERPQYGEYATPAEVAAARGLPAPDTRGESDPVARLAEPIRPNPNPNLNPKPTAESTSSPLSSRLRQAAPPPGRPVPTRHPGQLNALLTVLLLVFGIWNTVTSIPSYLDLGPSLTEGLVTAGYRSIGFGPTAHTVGIVLLVFSFLVLIAAVGVSLRRIRMGRNAVWVPLVFGAGWLVGLVVAMIVVVANTPGVTTLLQNHS